MQADHYILAYYVVITIDQLRTYITGYYKTHLFFSLITQNHVYQYAL